MHWHSCAWEINPKRKSDWSTSMNDRPRLRPGQVHIIAEPDSKMWKEQGHGAYVMRSGEYAFAQVVWRCDGKCLG